MVRGQLGWKGRIVTTIWLFLVRTQINLNKEAFEVLVQAEILKSSLGEKLIKMIGFRNIAIHEYGKLDMEIVRSIIENQLDDFRDFIRVAVQYL